MFKLFFIFGNIIFLSVLLNSCSSQPKQSQDESHSYIKLSSEEQQSFQHPNEQPSAKRYEQASELPPSQTTSGITNLPIQDFKERWNAISEEQMSNLFIENLEELTNNNETIYRSRLSKYIDLHLRVNGDYIRQIEMISEDKSPSTVYTMLSGWSQIIFILHPTIEIYDVDTFFNKIGVGPNADLTNLKAISITYFDINFEILPTDKGYRFTASINSL